MRRGRCYASAFRCREDSRRRGIPLCAQARQEVPFPCIQASLHIIKKLFSIVVVLLLLIVPSSCGSEFDSIPSGQKIVLSSGNVTKYLDIDIKSEGKYNLKDQGKAVSYKVVCHGYDDHFSYFNVKIVYSFNAKLVNR